MPCAEAYPVVHICQFQGALNFPIKNVVTLWKAGESLQWVSGFAIDFPIHSKKDHTIQAVFDSDLSYFALSSAIVLWNSNKDVKVVFLVRVSLFNSSKERMVCRGWFRKAAGYGTGLPCRKHTTCQLAQTPSNISWTKVNINRSPVMVMMMLSNIQAQSVISHCQNVQRRLVRRKTAVNFYIFFDQPVAGWFCFFRSLWPPPWSRSVSCSFIKEEANSFLSLFSLDTLLRTRWMFPCSPRGHVCLVQGTYEEAGSASLHAVQPVVETLFSHQAPRMEPLQGSVPVDLCACRPINNRTQSHASHFLSRRRHHGDRGAWQRKTKGEFEAWTRWFHMRKIFSSGGNVLP